MYTKGEWKSDGNLVYALNDQGFNAFDAIVEVYKDGKATDKKKLDELKSDVSLISAAPDMYEALKEANKLIEIARQFFPKSIHNNGRFQLENTCAAIGKAINKAEGK